MIKIKSLKREKFNSDLDWTMQTTEGGKVAKELLEALIFEATRQVVASLAA